MTSLSSSGSFIEVRDLSVAWNDAPPVLTSVSFDVRRGEMVAILGGSGSGKTTLLHSLIGLIEPRSGTITGEGSPSLTAARPKFGVSFQHGALLGSMTVAENIALPLTRWTNLPPPATMAVVRSTLSLVGLGAAEHKLPGELSGGMMKRAAIARALVLEPTALFLDEPSSGLDPPTSAGIDQLISTLRRVLGLTVIFISHDLDSIFALADRCILLGDGTILAAGPPAELAESPNPRIQDFFRRGEERKVT